MTMPGYEAGLNPNPYDPAKAQPELDKFTSAGGTVPTEHPVLVQHGRRPRQDRRGARRRLDQGQPSLSFKLNGIETNSYWTQLSENKAPALFRMGWVADYPVMENFIYLFTTEGGQYGSYTLYSNPQVDKLYEQARGTVDTTQRLQALQRGREAHPRRRALRPRLHVPRLPRHQQPYRRLQLQRLRPGRHVEGLGEISTRFGCPASGD